ncbi:MAG: hypothetical protein ACRDNO_06195 [Trebonia sp.]
MLDALGPDRLRAEIRLRASDPYLLTVTSSGRPHCGTVSVAWDAGRGPLAVSPVPHTWADSEAAGYRQVTLLWPPAEPGGYSLIVDGTGTGARAEAGDDPALVVTVSRAVLHRRGSAPAGGSSACGSDCVPLIG